jgi:hypothetical protein
MLFVPSSEWNMEIFVCELGDIIYDLYLKWQLRATKYVNTGVRLRTELCTLVYLFMFGLFQNAFNFSSSFVLWPVFGPWPSSPFSSNLLSFLLLPSRCFQFLKLYYVKCMGSQIFQKCRSHHKIPGARRVTWSKLITRAHRYYIPPCKIKLPW